MSSDLTSPQPTDLQIRLALQIANKLVRDATPAKTHLKEGALAKAFGVSRSPIRGALQLLERKGIVASKANHGFFLEFSGEQLDIQALNFRETDAETLYRNIIADRVRGKLADIETEADLIRRYDVTRAQLTRTLAILSQEGIVEKGQGYGWRFSPALNTERAHDESYAFRLLIEPAGPLQDTFKLDQGRLKKSRQAHHDLLERNSDGVSVAELFAVNADFHEMIAEFSGNRFMLQAVQQQNRLRRLLEYRGFQTQNAERVQASCEEHLAIMDALERGDNEWASTLLKRHLQVASKLKLGFQES